MNELNWISELQWQDVSRPLQELKGEAAYTLYIDDFLKMPDVDYEELSAFDPLVKALFN